MATHSSDCWGWDIPNSNNWYFMELSSSLKVEIERSFSWGFIVAIEFFKEYEEIESLGSKVAAAITDPLRLLLRRRSIVCLAFPFAIKKAVASLSAVEMPCWWALTVIETNLELGLLNKKYIA